jgi:KDO2-lipid IV(A) lauroyltransferase
MSEKKRSRAFDYLVYLAVRILVCVVQALPFERACGFARLLAWVVYKIDKRHRLVALDNLRQAFPGKYSELEINRMVRRVYLHFCTMLIEIMFLPRTLHQHSYKRRVVLRDAALMSEAVLSGRPVLFVTGHFGNWEMAGYTMAMFGVKSHAIARPLENPYLDAFLSKFRERTGQKLLAKKEDFAEIEKVLAEGGMLGTLADQDAGQRGVFVDFFGRPASTHKGVALLAIEHNVPILVAGMPKLDGKYQIWPIDMIFPEDYASDPDPVRAITQRFTAGLEELIRATPEQYFWVHRRWKHQPKKRGKRPQAA